MAGCLHANPLSLLPGRRECEIFVQIKTADLKFVLACGNFKNGYCCDARRTLFYQIVNLFIFFKINNLRNGAEKRHHIGV